MHTRTEFGWRLLAISALVALVGCSNTAATSSNATAGTRVAGNTTGGGNTHSVNAVSDALGQRLDGMLNTRQTGH
jgi:hypothetical protein